MRQQTGGGNPKLPGYDVYLEWIASAWEGLPTDMTSASFKHCGIMNATDGSENHLIACFKSNGPVPAGRQRLAEQRLADDTDELLLVDDDVDLEQDAENGYINDDGFVEY